MQNSKNFGLSDSLIEAVKEALHPNQKKLDKNKNGKLDADDFKKLRGEEAEHVDEAQTPQQKAARAALATQRGEYDAGKKGGAINRMALMKKKDLQKIAKGKTKNEEVELDEAETKFVIKHKKSGKVLSTHSNYNDAKDEHNGISKDRDDYGIFKQTKKDAALANRNTMREEAEQVDEISDKVKNSYIRKADKQVTGTDAGLVKKDGGLKVKGVSAADFVRKYKNRKAGIKKAMGEEVTEAAVTGNVAYGYHGSVQAKDDTERAKKYSAMHTKTKKLVGAAGHLRDAKHPNKMVKHFLDSPHGRHIADDPSDKNITSRFGHFKKSYKPHMHEEVQVAEADEQDPVAKQIAAKKEQMKKQIQQKIAQKQMSVMQQKAQKKIQSIKASTHDDMENDMKKKGKDAVEVNPELREAEDLPKKVIKKGHEIAKSLIKHKADVKEPYAVGMATAKKSAGIKD